MSDCQLSRQAAFFTGITSQVVLMDGAIVCLIWYHISFVCRFCRPVVTLCTLRGHTSTLVSCKPPNHRQNQISRGICLLGCLFVGHITLHTAKHDHMSRTNHSLQPSVGICLDLL